MKFKAVGKSLILTDMSHKIYEGENCFDTVEIIAPRRHDKCDLSELSFRFSAVSEDGKKSAVQILKKEKYDEDYVFLSGEITSDFSAIKGKITFMLTGIDSGNTTAKFQSIPYQINDDLSVASVTTDSAEQLFNRAQLEVQKAIDAAERAELASQTPAPAEIYPATATRLGGVKVDGKTITAAEDGTISALESENLKSEIAELKSSQESISKFATQIAHPNNFLIYDDFGKPSVMVAIPKFYLDELIDGASHTVHPAFIINGVEQDVIYISKYKNIIENNCAYSLPMKGPAVNISLTQAWNYCKNKGEGWHLMTNAEWSAIALWCKKNGNVPKGNNFFGKDISEINLPQKAIAASIDSNGKINRTLTGSGRESWFHDGTFAGIADLNGDIQEFVSGLRLNNGEILIIPNNDAADFNNSISFDSSLWKAVMQDGTLVAPGTVGTLKLDYSVDDPNDGRGTTEFYLSDKLEHQQINSKRFGYKPFADLSAKSGVEIPEIIKALALFPTDKTGYGEQQIWMVNDRDTIALRSGKWDSGDLSGVFRLRLGDRISDASSSIGFRCAYYGKL